jgi:hypothetical protein
MLRLKLHMVLVIQITGNSTQASYHLIYLAISLGRKIRAELNREEGAAKITHSLKILLDQKVKVELDMKERIGMETHSLDMATQTARLTQKIARTPMIPAMALILGLLQTVVKPLSLGSTMAKLSLRCRATEPS